jgi:SAM-dependent methyltransferase
MMNAEAGQWEKIFQRDGRLFLEPRPQIMQFADMLKEHGLESILDLGCGTGRHVVHMAHKGLLATGLDHAPTALKLTREWLNEEGLTASLVMADMLDLLPFKDGSFEAVLSTQVIHHARLAAVIETAGEISRITRMNGMILVSVPTYEAIREDSPEFIEIEPNTFIPTSGSEKGLPHHIFTRDEFQNLFPHFQVLDLQEIDHRVIVLTAVKNPGR